MLATNGKKKKYQNLWIEISKYAERYCGKQQTVHINHHIENLNLSNMNPTKNRLISGAPEW